MHRPQRFRDLVAVLTFALLLVFTSLACGGASEQAATGDDDYAARMAAEHAGDSPTASPATEAAPAGEVVEARVTYATVGGKPVAGFLARPANADAPGLIVIHEWWGLNDNVEAMARRLAGEGYAALAVDLYGGASAATPDEARALMSASAERTGELEDNLRQARAFLAAHGAGKIGVIGWCFGGGWSLQTALLMPDEIDATVIYYGRLVTDRDELAKLDMPILGLFGSEDRGIPVESVRAFEAALGELGKEASIHVYEGANHAFANPSGGRYNEEAAEDAWAKTLAFLHQHLAGGA